MQNITIDGKEISFAFLESAVAVIDTFENDEGEANFICPVCGGVAHITRHRGVRSSRIGTLVECKCCKQKIIS